jgi:hypothetical protein
MTTMRNMTMQNITYVGPGSSCAYLGARPPPQWRAENSTDAACRVANCLSNSAAIQKCCAGGTVETFNRTIANAGGNMTVEGQYLFCALPGINASTFDDFGSYDPANSYQAYQDCLVNEGARYLTCNRPGTYRFGGESFCTTGGITTPAGFGAYPPDNYVQVCTVNTNQGGSGPSTISNCCRNGNGTLRAQDSGCQATCAGGESLSRCVFDGVSGTGVLALCSNVSQDEGGSGGSGAAAGSNVSSAKMALIGVLMLSTILMADL